MSTAFSIMSLTNSKHFIFKTTAKNTCKYLANREFQTNTSRVIFQNFRRNN